MEVDIYDWQHSIIEEGIEVAFEDVRDFHRACGLPDNDRPTLPTRDEVRLRERLIREEVDDELAGALYVLGDESEPEEGRWAAMTAAADAIADSIYVLLGTAATFGLPMAEIWKRVHESNMAKVKDGVRRRADGKILKPEGWQPPDVEGAIKEAMR